jgi:hypothetical protein
MMADGGKEKNIDSLPVYRSQALFLVQSELLHLAVAKNAQWVSWAPPPQIEEVGRE